MDGWERKRRRKGYTYPWFTRRSYWVGGKGGQTGYPKRRIVYSSGSRWHVTWMHNAIPIPFALVCVLSTILFSWLHSSRMCSPEECGCCSGTATLLPCYHYQSYCYRCCCCYPLPSRRNSRLASSNINRISSFFWILSIHFYCALVSVSTRLFVTVFNTQFCPLIRFFNLTVNLLLLLSVFALCKEKNKISKV